MLVQIVNFGCRLNIAEGEAIRKAAGVSEAITVINSCAVTNEAVLKTRQAIRRAKRARPDADRGDRVRRTDRSGTICGDARG